MENNPENSKKRNPNLPGLDDYTLDQLFYISFAQSHCQVYYTSMDFYDEHSPAKFRVLGSLSNSKHFNKVFNCPVKSNMNPEEKCSLW